MNVEHYSFLAIRGQQGKHSYFLTQCPLRLVPRLFSFDEIEIPPDLRQLHSINTGRIDSLTKYLTNQPFDYVLAPLTASMDCQPEFKPLSDESPNTGQLLVPLSARLIIHDGQHRRAAIEKALTQEPSIGNDTVPIMLIPDPQFSRSTCLYSDLNQPQKQRTKSQRILHDYDSPLANLVRHLVEEVPLFKGFTEIEKTTISNRSTALFTLSAIYQATQAFLGIGKQEQIPLSFAKLSRQFWDELWQVIPGWRGVVEGKLKSAELRQNYVHAHGVTLVAIGYAGHSLVENHPNDWTERLKILGDIDWSRTNVELWEGRAMIRGRMSKAKDSVQLTNNIIKQTLRLQLSEKETNLEKRFADLSG